MAAVVYLSCWSQPVPASRPDRILSVAALSPSDRSKVRGLLLFGRSQLSHPWRLADEHWDADAILWPSSDTEETGTADNFILAAPHWWSSSRPSGSISNALLDEKAPVDSLLDQNTSPTAIPHFKTSLVCPPDLLAESAFADCSVSCWPLGRLSSASLLPALDDLDSWIHIQSGILSDTSPIEPDPKLSGSAPIIYTISAEQVDRPSFSSSEERSGISIPVSSSQFRPSDVQIHDATMNHLPDSSPVPNSLSKVALSKADSTPAPSVSTEPKNIVSSGLKSSEPATRSWFGHLVSLANTPITLPGSRKNSDGNPSISDPHQSPAESQPAAGILKNLGKSSRRIGKFDSESDIRLLVIGRSGSGKSTAIASVTTSEVGVANGSGVASLGASRPGAEFSRITDQGLCRSGEVRVWLSAVTSTHSNGSSWPLPISVAADKSGNVLPDFSGLLAACDGVLVLVDASRPSPLEDLKKCLVDLSILPSSGVVPLDNPKQDDSETVGLLPPSSTRSAVLVNGRLGYRPVLIAYTHLDDGNIPPGFRASLSEMMGFQAPVLPMDPRDRSAVTRAVALLSGSALRARSAHDRKLPSDTV
jgi:hypothetical protein